MSREYEIALQYVRSHYPRLYARAKAVVLTPARQFATGDRGLCSPDNYVVVNDCITTVGEFVETIVHELVHCKQNDLNEPKGNTAREEQAYEAGILAAQRYEIDAAPWRRK